MTAASDRPGAARDRILDTAFRLFYARGIRAVGVDTIIAESGVAKATFYKHFPAKDDLVVAYLDRVDGIWTGQLHAAAAGRRRRPADQLVGLFDALGTALPPRGLPRLRVHQRRGRVAAGHAGARPHRRAQDRRARLGARPRRAGRRARPRDPGPLADAPARRRARQRSLDAGPEAPEAAQACAARPRGRRDRAHHLRRGALAGGNPSACPAGPGDARASTEVDVVADLDPLPRAPEPARAGSRPGVGVLDRAAARRDAAAPRRPVATASGMAQPVLAAAVERELGVVVAHLGVERHGTDGDVGRVDRRRRRPCRPVGEARRVASPCTRSTARPSRSRLATAHA